MSKPSKQLVDAGVRWWLDPSTMVRELFGAEPDPWQDDVLKAFPSSPQLALQAPIALDMLVVTPDGQRLWGDVKKGDAVFADDGYIVRVKRRYDVSGVPLFRVTLCDGTEVRCTADHLWRVQATKYDRLVSGKWKTLSTAALMKGRIKEINSVHGRASRLITIPTQGAVEFPAAPLPLDPYVFGLWLGDGVAGEPTLVCPDMAIRDAVLGRGFILNPRRTKRECISVTLPGTIAKLRLTGMHQKRSFEKAIPTMYAYASVQQRMDLLRGLMDSDGTVTKNGQTYLATSSTELVKDFAWLARSLGYYATVGGPYKINGGKNRDSYRVTISGPVCPFLADTTKKRRWKAPPPYKSLRYIESIEPDGVGDAMCIEIDHPSHCFQIGDFIVTHNCKGPGKTTVLAWLAWNFLLTRPSPNIAATSINGDNLHDGLWKECAVWRNKSKLIQSLFDITSERIFRRGHKDTWFLSARTWPKSGNPQAQADTLAGLHADYICFILDESGGIPQSVMVAAEAALSSCVEGHILQAGNPTNLDGPLYAASRDRVENGGSWRVFEITGDPDDPKRSPRVKVEWAKDQIRKYGRDNPWVLVNVFGKFPPGSINSLLSEDEVRAAMKRYYRPHEIGGVAKVLGVDVARQGLDASVICPRHGIQTYPLRRYRGVENGVIGASITNRIWTEFDADACFVDATGGWGFTWIDQLQVLGKTPIGIGFANKAQSEERFVNRRAEMYWRAADWIKQGGALPGEETEGAREMLEALTKTTYFHTRDRIQIEEKDQIKDRIGFSPDEADAFVLTFAETITPKVRSAGRANHNAAVNYNMFGDLERMQQRGSAAGDYNPFRSG